MDEPISIRLTGHAAAFPATREARDALRQYVDDARTRLRFDPDADEIVRDLETAIGDRLSTHEVLTGNQMTAILADLGPVGAANPSPPRGRFWCRIEEKQWFGGICGGLAAYGNFSLDWTRTIALALLAFSGGLLVIPYLILLFVLPVVPTFAEYERQRDSPR
ncbi:hypothetical protein Ais01nite_23250 [Asanoa ishikariensis]|uniref:Phage shock protein C (PspC) family protein n=1 Tax=Asanoa ishikariensis TaxID=137265 RepID=A0A1H3R8H8_9ACTN|nr:PspC domain-containing protein [Asanoa ishikariensis]GIF64290.1 hypothetical protein Ais01nite_23250 [Asanoa ishikariensis]SDZ21977.1 phage shock protein C (PspC) family protein [Asanoa ishikariensis]